MAVEALTRPDAIHLAPLIAKVFAWGAVKANPAPNATTFDLNHVDKHGWIEHDVSLSRADTALGDNATFSAERWNQMVEHYAKAPGGVVGHKEAALAHYARVEQSKVEHQAVGLKVQYGAKEAVGSYGESALFMNLLGKDGQVPLEYMRIFFGRIVLTRLL
jgi:hypothetical protein